MSLVYIPVVRRKFDAELAQKRFETTLATLQLIAPDIVAPQAPLGEPNELLDFIENLAEEPTAIIFQQLTFTGQEFVTELVKRYSVPVFLLIEKEPSVHGWLHLNAMTGLLSTANYLHMHGQVYQQFIGGVDEEAGAKAVRQFISSVDAYQDLQHLTVGVVGTFPPGFNFSGTNPQELRDQLGVSLKHYSIDQAFKTAAKVAPAEYQDQLTYAQEHLKDLDPADPRAIKMAQYVTVMQDHVHTDGLGAFASRCWPDFFEKFDSAPGGVFSQLTNQKTPVAEEGDIHGAVSMYALQALNGHQQPVFLGDLCRLDEADNSLTIWHDYGPYDLANPDYPATAGVHPNRKIGVSVDGSLKPGEVTLLRVHYDTDGYHLISIHGKALPVENQYNGFSGKVQVDLPITELVNDLAQSGAESHFALVYGDYTTAIKWLGQWLRLPVTQY
ncbi:hypothetical protein [Levilactobacillus yiduensis]|uniref:hypothetical protein n=1 Tax=Levilactobacillus yiduensis TaxID=2953880 RepID=UPI00215884DB|nr:hypothetical protein [Levilactobacillus yiduensis]